MRVGSELIEYAASTHTGLKRRRNEDCFVAEATLGLWLVADGVGGHSDGDIASAIIKATVTEQVASGAMLLDAVRQAHVEILNEIRRLGTDSRMGSTVVGLTVVGDEYKLVWVGDSRAYLWDGRELCQLTRDHTHVRDLVDRGLLAIEDVASHADRHALTQSMGISSDMNLNPGELSGQLSQGQQILLCSDGLTDELLDATIAAHLGAHASAQAQADALLNATLAAGARDNVTLVVVGTPGAQIMDTKLQPDQPVSAGSKLSRLALAFAVLCVVVAVLLWV
jgi:serine/threonine protein phosphatase PrpC